MVYEMEQRISTILSIVLLVAVGLLVLRSSGVARALAGPWPRPPSDAPWSANVKVNDDVGTAYQELPDIAVDPSGNAYAAWTDYRNGNEPDIYFSHGFSWEPTSLCLLAYCLEELLILISARSW